MSDVARIRQLLADANTARSPGARRALDAFAPASLVTVLRSDAPWWVRAAVVPALAPKLDAPRARALLERAEDPREVEEVRCACVDALADARRTEVVPALLKLDAALDREPARTWRLGEAVISAAARLGATKAAPAAVALRYDPWSYRRARGEEALRGLVSHVGIDGVARALGGADASDAGLSAMALTHPNAPARRWAVDTAGRDAPWLVDALWDGDALVADGAVDRLADAQASADLDARLDALAAHAKAPVHARARALLTLCRRGREDLARPRWNAMPDARVRLRDVPDDVRRAVLARFLPGERGTDPRWRLEGILDLDLDLDGDREWGMDGAPDEIVSDALGALREAGLDPGEAVPIGAVRQQGGGTWRVVSVGGVALDVCELGRFVACESVMPTRARDALVSKGFRVIEGALARAVFEGLAVYCFGRREALTVHGLLFYWQD